MKCIGALQILRCRPKTDVIESPTMVSSRWYRTCVLLLAVWLLADTASFAFCDPQPFGAVAATSLVNAGHDQQDGSTQSGDRPCLCCSHGAQIVTFDLHVTQEPEARVYLPRLRLIDVSPRQASPPPRF
jgi:hypothetical protein